MTVNQGDKMVFVSIGARPQAYEAGKSSNEATIWLVRYEPERSVPVTRGENSGRTLTYVNVARDWMPLGVWTGDAVTFRLARQDLDADRNSAFAVLVQQMDTGPIVGAAHFRLPDE